MVGRGTPHPPPPVIRALEKCSLERTSVLTSRAYNSRVAIEFLFSNSISYLRNLRNDYYLQTLAQKMLSNKNIATTVGLLVLIDLLHRPKLLI